MTDGLELYQPGTNIDNIQQRTPDDWFEAFGNIIKLAEYVADTEFVPDTMRRRPAAVAAAILTGREMGLSPMVALRMLHIIKGRVGQSAELMRALVLRAGHEIRDIEITDNRVILEGRRRGETDWARANFTVEDARKAKIDLGGYPKDKLYARATTRLCRRKFADIIAGLPSVDELEDGWTDTPEPTTNGVPGAPVQRARKSRPAKAAATQPKPAPTPTTPDPDIVELLEDGEYGDEAEQRLAAAERIAEQDQRNAEQLAHETEPAPAEANSTGDDWADHPPVSPGPGQMDLLDEPNEIRMATTDQLTKIAVLLRTSGFDDHETRHAFVSAAIGHPYDKPSELTLDEASNLIDVLENDRGGANDDE